MAEPMAQPPKESGSQPLQQEGIDAAWMLEYGPALRAYFRKEVGSADADDLVHDVYVTMQSRGGVDHIEHVDRYLFRVAANVLAKRGKLAEWNWQDLRGLEGLQALVDDLSPERAFIAKDTLKRLVATLQTLPPRAAHAFILHRFEEMSYGEIAKQMGLSVKAVESHVKRTLDRVMIAMGAAR